jgi:hypothetical protein
MRNRMQKHHWYVMCSTPFGITEFGIARAVNSIVEGL